MSTKGFYAVPMEGPVSLLCPQCSEYVTGPDGWVIHVEDPTIADLIRIATDHNRTNHQENTP